MLQVCSSGIGVGPSALTLEVPARGHAGVLCWQFSNLHANASNILQEVVQRTEGALLQGQQSQQCSRCFGMRETSCRGWPLPLRLLLRMH